MRSYRCPTAADVVVVGGGASGVLASVHVLRQAKQPVHVVVLEPRDALAEGIAWSTTEPTHLLNVPACRMSGLPSRPRDFMDWAGCEATDFLPRASYAAYLRDLLKRSLDAAPAGSRLDHVRCRAVDVERGRVRTDRDDEISATAVILAVGHDAPELPADLEVDRAALGSVVTDPWAPGALDDLAPGETVLCLGTGLTFVDVALSLLSRDLTTRVVGVSRTGGVPLAHEHPWREPVPSPDFPETVGPADIAHWVRVQGHDWRRAVDALRPITPRLWRRWDAETKADFIRHWARAWEVHRHRMAPGVGTVFARLVRAGRIEVQGGGVQAVRRQGDRLEIFTGSGRRLTVDRVVLCTGPTGRADRSPLLARLLEAGTVAAGPLGLGVRADPDTGAVHHREGVSDWLFALGPLLRGELWEATAIPEIALHAETVAHALPALSVPSVREEIR